MNSEAMHRLTYGLFVLTAREGERDGGCILNTVMQLTARPDRIGVCVNRNGFTHDRIRQTGAFTVSVLSREAPAALYHRFGYRSGWDMDKFAGFTACERGANGIWYITEGTNAYMAARVQVAVNLGSHTLFVGEVTEAKVLSDAASATYDDYLRRIRPVVASGDGEGQAVWRCSVCGYEYAGDTLPPDYLCPICRHPAADFEKIVKEKER